MRITCLSLALTALLGACASTPPEPDPVQVKLTDLETRVARMERIAANQAEMSQRLDDIQQNLRELRGRVEELEHSNEALSRQQHDLYADLDKRLTRRGRRGSGCARGRHRRASRGSRRRLRGGAATDMPPVPPGAQPGAAPPPRPSRRSTVRRSMR